MNKYIFFIILNIQSFFCFSKDIPNHCNTSEVSHENHSISCDNKYQTSFENMLPDAWYLHLYQLMKDVHELFTLYEIEYWAQGGTLLGAVRHKGIIPWDDDLDINIKLSDKDLFCSLIPALNELGYDVAEVWFGYKIAAREIFTLGGKRGAPCLDMFFTIEKDDKIYYNQHWMQRDNEPIYITKEELYPLRAYAFGEIIVIGPNNPIPYLNASYSDNWPYFGKIVNHFYNLEEERYLTPKDMVYAQPSGPLEEKVFANSCRPIRVYASMVADLFHYGHVRFLQQAKALGTHVIVGIIPDSIATTYKREPIFNQEERGKVVAGCKYVDEVIQNVSLVASKEFIEAHNIDLVVHGDDFDQHKIDLYFKDPMEMNILRIVAYTEGISTSQVLERIKAALSNNNKAAFWNY